VLKQFDMRTVLQIKDVEIDNFLQLCKVNDVECIDIQLAKFNNIPADFYYCEVVFINPVCLFDIGRALEALTNN